MNWAQLLVCVCVRERERGIAKQQLLYGKVDLSSHESCTVSEKMTLFVVTLFTLE